MALTLKVSSKTTEFNKKPRIKKGYYPVKLIDVKPRQKEDGTPIEGKYGRQIIMIYKVYDEDRKTVITWKPKNNVEEEVMIAMVLNSEYKDQKTGGYRTAVTPNSRITSVLEALGWQFNDEKSLDIEEFIGCWAEANIGDYEVQVRDANGLVTDTYIASAIEKLVSLEGEKPKDDAIPEEEPSSGGDIDDQITKLKEIRKAGGVSDEGYAEAVARLKKNYKG